MNIGIFSCVVAALGLARTALALATYNPIADGPSYSVGLPPGTTASPSSPRTLYFSIQAPSSYQWVALGIGQHMAGSTIFLVYPDGTGNVTLSTRNGVGHVQPKFNSTMFADVELLEGSGVTGGMMRANVKCTACKLNSASTTTSSPWIAAWKPEGSIASTNEAYSIPKHDDDTMRQFTFDLSTATISEDANPFLSSPPASPGSSPNGPYAHGGHGEPSQFRHIPTYQKAHGTLMAVTVLLLFPFGAIFMRVFGSPLIHGLIQTIALCTLVAGFGLGINLAHIIGILFNGHGKTHTIFGLVIVILFLLQPFGGLLHHRLYVRTGGRTAVSHIHIWLGRAVIICGMVNGGLGLKLAGNTRGGEIAYGVVAGVVALVYAATVVVKRKSGKGKGDKSLRQTDS